MSIPVKPPFSEKAQECHETVPNSGFFLDDDDFYTNGKITVQWCEVLRKERWSLNGIWLYLALLKVKICQFLYRGLVEGKNLPFFVAGLGSKWRFALFRDRGWLTEVKTHKVLDRLGKASDPVLHDAVNQTGLSTRLQNLYVHTATDNADVTKFREVWCQWFNQKNCSHVSNMVLMQIAGHLKWQSIEQGFAWVFTKWQRPFENSELRLMVIIDLHHAKYIMPNI